MKEGDRVSDASSQRCCSRAPASSPTLVDLDARIKATAPLVLPEISLCTTDGRPGKGDIRAQPLAPVRRRRISSFRVDGITISYLRTSTTSVRPAGHIAAFAGAGITRAISRSAALPPIDLLRSPPNLSQPRSEVAHYTSQKPPPACFSSSENTSKNALSIFKAFDIRRVAKQAQGTVALCCWESHMMDVA